MAAAGIQRAEVVRVIRAAGLQGSEAVAGATGAPDGSKDLAEYAWGQGGADGVLNTSVPVIAGAWLWCSAGLRGASVAQKGPVGSVSAWRIAPLRARLSYHVTLGSVASAAR